MSLEDLYWEIVPRPKVSDASDFPRSHSMWHDRFFTGSTLFLYTTTIVGLSLRRHNLLKIFEIFYRYHSNQHSYLPARLSMNKSSVSLSVFTFPCDVERLIFEQAALSDRKTNVQLITVSKRAQFW